MSDGHGGTLVMGLGNPIMGDDGLGIVALEELRRCWRISPGIRLEDGGTWGMSLLPLIEETDRLLVIDAIKAGGSPGTLVCLEGDDLPRYFALKLSPHQIDLKEVLAVCHLRGSTPREVVALGLEPDSIDMSTELSVPVAEALPHLLQEIVNRLGDWGLSCVPVPGPTSTSTTGPVAGAGAGAATRTGTGARVTRA